MAIEFTKGPWSVSSLVRQYVIGPEPKFVTVASVAQFKRNGDVEMLFDGDHAEANARLIAAAPELLEALKDFVDMQAQCFGDGIKTHLAMIGCAAQAKAAIDRAESK